MHLDELVAEPVGLYVPALQGVPAELCVEQYIPGGQAKQLVMDVCRVTLLKVPAGQAVEFVRDGQ